MHAAGLEGPDQQTVSCVDVTVALQQDMDGGGRGLQGPTAVRVGATGIHEPFEALRRSPRHVSADVCGLG